jgi:hypothetical protein
MAPILSPSLQQLIAAASRRGDVPPRMLLQSYDAPAPRCEVRTRNAAIVEIARTASGSGITWVDYLVVAPEPDGTTRIDDILFSTRRSDTLRVRSSRRTGIRRRKPGRWRRRPRGRSSASLTCGCRTSRVPW